VTEIADRYRRIAAAFTEKVAAVPPDRWSSPSPCDEWDARGVVRHVVEAHGMFEGMVGRQPRPGPSVDEDPLGAWTAARDQLQEELEDPAQAGEEFDGFFGRSTFAGTVERILIGDVMVHTWDLARATGQDEALPADEVDRALAGFSQMGDAVRSAGVFGDEVPAPPGADPQTRLLCFTGRDPAAAR
jgi:uncharacterized protein (TIGR03086 family)